MTKSDLFGEPLPIGARRGMGSHQSGAMKNDEWLTPPSIVGALGSFDLDPCAAIVRPWPTAETHYTIEDNGLLKPWFGRVWLNPPYGDQVGTWMGRLREHGDGIALIFARTETDVWFEHVWDHATGILFIRSRLYFYDVRGHRAEANSGAPSVLIAYGAANAMILQRVATDAIPGKYLRLPPGASRTPDLLAGT